MNRYPGLKRIARSAALAAVPLAALFALSGCQSDDKAPAATPSVIVSAPVARDVNDVDVYTGRFEAVDTVDVRPRVSGYLDKVAFQDGATVRKGDLLFVIDPRPYQAAVTAAQGALERAQSQLKLSRQDFERASILIKTDTIAQSLYDQRRQAVQSAQAEVTSAQGALERARLDLSFTRIVAPMSGRISRKLVSEGNLVKGGDSDATVLTTIVSQDPIDIYFDVDEESYLRYTREARKSGGNASSRQVAIALPGDAQPSLAGTMDFVDNRLDDSTGTLRQRARVANPDRRLSPGQFGRVYLSSRVAHPALLVPDAAVATDATRRVLYFVDANGTVAIRPVTPGRLYGNLREIDAGLNAGDTVIVDGFQRVQAGDKVKAVPRAIEAATVAHAASGTTGSAQ
ncbi:efflux RND transporter periplasmic adaptor subunit [Burkholderia cenocepacia]|uniref:efflux RND transporter periplasmic adaptor subunit n=1 Tax=Burkholderia cepacia complex TaxID=87882 RepID=UPI000F564A5C|nr:MULTISPECIES: efflux RND transporter periplasmic adaptor subunit [Burkholderia cepacia complex]ELW9448716.1 efflux RND transporter periplasmic adaptor subunit [Burkholderia cenocepacia]MBR8485037.1 efflux RND transporter periplasmic adaptor subunit [Burkholderia cenocepacia]MDN7470374.1 efflux RND transporter periplasmic adaptor subunit [Burkholderia orbicola]MDN7501757.1 efflux RND transporter periplasmic adaptor subunit [Burkholderia orbicola]RQU18490.1 efflux RND transporter periplasmic 